MRHYFSIVSMGRSGSTFLQKLIDSHPDIICLGEVISRSGPFSQRDGNVHEFIEGDMFGSAQGCVGFKMPWDHILDYPEVFWSFRKMEFKIILLFRENKLDQLISLKLAQKNNSWESTGVYEHQKIHITTSEAESFIITASHTDFLLGKMCDSFPHISTTYERIIRGQDHDIIQDFLKVPRHTLEPGTTRGRTRPRSETIENFSELEEYFRHTDYHAFFTAPEEAPT